MREDANKTQRAMVRNILKTYRAATDEQRNDGAQWYVDAHAVAVSLFGDAELGAGVLAALSPLTPWSRNVMLAAMVADGRDPSTLPTLGIARVAVARIVAGEHWSDVLRGQKVRAFAAAIASGGVTDVVCVDRHARDIAYRVAYAGVGHKRSEASAVGVREYRAIAAAYARAAAIVGVSAAVLQAVTWCVQRGGAA